MKPFIRRGLKIGGAIVALYLGGLVAFGVKVILTDAVPVIAKHKAEATQRQRDEDFKAATAGSAQMAMDSCVIDESWPSFISGAQTKVLSEPLFNRTGWKPLCKYTTGFTGVDYPSVMCGYLSSLGRFKKKAPANPLDNGAGYYEVWGKKIQAEVQVAGETCFSDSSYRFRYSAYTPFPTSVDYSAAPRNASKTGNLRLKIEQCSDLHLGPQHCIATIWVSQERASWGSYLVEEYITQLRQQVIGAVFLVAFIVASLIATAWRIIVVSSRRDQDSLIPWIVEVPLTAAALDHEPYFLLNDLLDGCENCLDRRFMKWPILFGLMIQGMPTLLARRVAYLMQRPFVIGAERTANLWKVATAGITGRK